MEIRNSILIFLVFCLPFHAFAQGGGYSINLSDWPQDIVQSLIKEVPDITSKNLTEEQVNRIIKTLDRRLGFNTLRVLKVGSSQELRLTGEISPSIEKIQFEGLEDIAESDALLLMGLNSKNAIDEDYLRSGLEKLTQYYQEQGYRFASTSFEFKTVSTLKRNLVIKVAAKKQTQLTEIVIENLDPQATAEISRKLNWDFKNAVLNQDTMNKVSLRLRKLLSQEGYFLTPVTSPRLSFSADELKAKAFYTLEKKQKYGIEIINANAKSISYLEEDVLKLETFTTTESNIGAELSERLKAFYRSEGYPHINIPFYERKWNDKIIITLNLEEGPYVKIKTLNFVGQISREPKYYEKKFYEFAGGKVQSKVYVKEEIEQAAKNLLVDLQNEGFVNARLGLVQITTDRERPADGLVIIQIYEGEPVDINSIEFIGNKSFSTAKLLQEMDLSPNEKLNLKKLEASLLKLKNFYNSAGFIEFRLQNEKNDLVQYTNKNSLAQLKFKIEEGPRVEVQSILIEGNEMTHDKVILTEIDFKPGEVLTPAKIEESISRLQRTGHFATIEISMLETGTPVAQRTVLIKVNERDPGVFTFGGGLTNENNGTIHGYTGIAYRNIGGWGRGISFRLEGNYNYADLKFPEQQITFGYVEPYLFESRTRLRLNATRSKKISDVNLRKITELNETTVSFEQDFTSHITGILDLPKVATYVDRGIAEGDYPREDQVIASVGLTLDVDYRDNLFNPTRGHYSRLGLEYAFESGSSKIDEFFRASAQTTFYIPMTPKSEIVFAQSLRGGYVADTKPLGYGVPFDKKGFFLGGRTTIRGFNSIEQFPSTAAIGANFKMTTFSTYELLKSELRFPIVKKWDLMGAFFYDGGQVEIEGFNFPDKWRDAVGIGLRYNTPVGPLNLEYAKKLDKKDYEDEGAFHLSIGVF